MICRHARSSPTATHADSTPATDLLARVPVVGCTSGFEVRSLMPTFVVNVRPLRCSGY